MFWLLLLIEGELISQPVLNELMNDEPSYMEAQPWTLDKAQTGHQIQPCRTIIHQCSGLAS